MTERNLGNERTRILVTQDVFEFSIDFRMKIRAILENCVVRMEARPSDENIGHIPIQDFTNHDVSFEDVPYTRLVFSNEHREFISSVLTEWREIQGRRMTHGPIMSVAIVRSIGWDVTFHMVLDLHNPIFMFTDDELAIETRYKRDLYDKNIAETVSTFLMFEQFGIVKKRAPVYDPVATDVKEIRRLLENDQRPDLPFGNNSAVQRFKSLLQEDKKKLSDEEWTNLLVEGGQSMKAKFVAGRQLDDKIDDPDWAINLYYPDDAEGLKRLIREMVKFHQLKTRSNGSNMGSIFPSLNFENWVDRLGTALGKKSLKTQWDDDLRSVREASARFSVTVDTALKDLIDGVRKGIDELPVSPYQLPTDAEGQKRLITELIEAGEFIKAHESLKLFLPKSEIVESSAVPPEEDKRSSSFPFQILASVSNQIYSDGLEVDSLDVDLDQARASLTMVNHVEYFLHLDSVVKLDQRGEGVIEEVFNKLDDFNQGVNGFPLRLEFKVAKTVGQLVPMLKADVYAYVDKVKKGQGEVEVDDSDQPKDDKHPAVFAKYVKDIPNLILSYPKRFVFNDTQRLFDKIFSTCDEGRLEFVLLSPRVYHIHLTYKDAAPSLVATFGAWLHASNMSVEEINAFIASQRGEGSNSSVSHVTYGMEWSAMTFRLPELNPVDYRVTPISYVRNEGTGEITFKLMANW